jgi:hypothetical protein
MLSYIFSAINLILLFGLLCDCVDFGKKQAVFEYDLLLTEFPWLIGNNSYHMEEKITNNIFEILNHISSQLLSKHAHKKMAKLIGTSHGILAGCLNASFAGLIV